MLIELVSSEPIHGLVNNDNRVIAFKRWDDKGSLLVFASLADYPYTGYAVDSRGIESGEWKEVFNSDSAEYGGDNVGNSGLSIACMGGRVVILFAGFVVLGASRT